mgnify:CR=1 FL=1
MAEAKKNSIFSFLATECIMLYGRKGIITRKEPSGEIIRQEMELNQFAASHELPRMTSLDPVGLERTLAVLRAERLKV